MIREAAEAIIANQMLFIQSLMLSNVWFLHIIAREFFNRRYISSARYDSNKEASRSTIDLKMLSLFSLLSCLSICCIFAAKFTSRFYYMNDAFPRYTRHARVHKVQP